MNKSETVNKVRLEFGVVELEMDGDVVVVPLDDCIIEVVWSDKHERMVGVVREKIC